MTVQEIKNDVYDLYLDYLNHHPEINNIQGKLASFRYFINDDTSYLSSFHRNERYSIYVFTNSEGNRYVLRFLNETIDVKHNIIKNEFDS